MTLATYESLFAFTEYSPGSIPFYIGIGHELVENVVSVYTCAGERSYFDNIRYDGMTYIDEYIVLKFNVSDEQSTDFRTVGNNILQHDFPINMYVSTYDETVEVPGRQFLKGVSNDFLNKFYERLPMQYTMSMTM